MGINEIIDIGRKIKQLRIDAGISQKEMAEELKLNVSTYSNYENGHREPPAAVIKQIAEILDKSVEEMLSASELASAVIHKTEEDAEAILTKKQMDALGIIKDTCGKNEADIVQAVMTEMNQKVAFAKASLSIEKELGVSIEKVVETDLQEMMLKLFSSLNVEGRNEAIKRVGEMALLEKYRK